MTSIITEDAVVPISKIELLPKVVNSFYKEESNSSIDRIVPDISNNNNNTNISKSNYKVTKFDITNSNSINSNMTSQNIF